MSSNFIYKILFLIICLFLFKVLLLEINYTYPENIGHIIHQENKNHKTTLFKELQNYGNSIFNYCKLQLLNNFTFRILNYRLFNAHHIFGLYQYRVIHQLPDGTMIEPLKVFNEDLSSNQSATLFSTRYLQALLYSVSDAVREHRKNLSYEVPLYLNKLFKVICNYSAQKCSFKRISKHFIYVIPMDVPNSYIGSNKPWLKHKWQKFYEQDVTTGKVSYHYVDFNNSSFFPTSKNTGFRY